MSSFVDFFMKWFDEISVEDLRKLVLSHPKVVRADILSVEEAEAMFKPIARTISQIGNDRGPEL